MYSARHECKKVAMHLYYSSDNCSKYLLGSTTSATAATTTAALSTIYKTVT